MVSGSRATRLASGHPMGRQWQHAAAALRGWLVTQDEHARSRAHAPPLPCARSREAPRPATPSQPPAGPAARRALEGGQPGGCWARKLGQVGHAQRVGAQQRKQAHQGDEVGGQPQRQPVVGDVCTAARAAGGARGVGKQRGACALGWVSAPECSSLQPCQFSEHCRAAQAVQRSVAAAAAGGGGGCCCSQFHTGWCSSSRIV